MPPLSLRRIHGLGPMPARDLRYSVIKGVFYSFFVCLFLIV